MYILWLFNTTGLIFGPAIMLSGILALLLCLRATSWASTAPARRTAVVASFLPLALGLGAVAFGLAVWWYSGQIAEDRWVVWLALGKACLAGLVVSTIPLFWSLGLSLAQRRVG